jgi:hypothetical protein
MAGVRGAATRHNAAAPATASALTIVLSRWATIMVVRSCAEQDRASQSSFRSTLNLPIGLRMCIATHLAREGVCLVRMQHHACSANSTARMYRPFSRVQALLPCTHGLERLHMSQKHMQPGARALARRSSACCTMRSLALSSALVACAPAWRSCTPMEHSDDATSSTGTGAAPRRAGARRGS